MALSVEASPGLDKVAQESPSSFATSATRLVSPSSDRRFWSTLRNRVDTILECQHCEDATSMPINQTNDGGSNPSNRLKVDSLLLLRGFDSVSDSLTQLTNNIESALQGARELSKPPTMSDMLHIVSHRGKEDCNYEEAETLQEHEDERKGMKRKFEPRDCSDEQGGNSVSEEDEMKPKPAQVEVKLKKAKNLATVMAAKASSLSRELKSVKADVCFAQERCALLEEENRRLRDGFIKGVRPEEDDLVRLQLEALLAEKSRLANENANLTRENQCLRQLVEYHQFAARDVSSPTYETMQGVSLDFSSPTKVEETSLDFSSPIKVEETCNLNDLAAKSSDVDASEFPGY